MISMQTGFRQTKIYSIYDNFHRKLFGVALMRKLRSVLFPNNRYVKECRACEITFVDGNKCPDCKQLAY